MIVFTCVKILTYTPLTVRICSDSQRNSWPLLDNK